MRAPPVGPVVTCTGLTVLLYRADCSAPAADAGHEQANAGPCRRAAASCASSRSFSASLPCAGVADWCCVRLWLRLPCLLEASVARLRFCPCCRVPRAQSSTAVGRPRPPREPAPTPRQPAPAPPAPALPPRSAALLPRPAALLLRRASRLLRRAGRGLGSHGEWLSAGGRADEGPAALTYRDEIATKWLPHIISLERERVTK